MNFQQQVPQPFQPQSFGSMGNPLAPDLTGADLSSHLGLVGSQGGIYVQFFYIKVRIDSHDNPVLNGSYQTRLCIAKQPKGDRLTIATRYISEEEAMAVYPREFSMFKQAEAIPTNGTPLSELPGISASQIAIMVVHNLRCIEDVVQAAPEHVNGMGLDAISVRELAVRWTNNRAKNGDLIASAQNSAATAVELAQLRAADAAKEKRINELQAQLDVLTRMGAHGTQVQAVPSFGAPMAVDAPDSPDMPMGDSQLFSGGTVTGNDDLNEPEIVPTPADPLGIGRKGR